MDQPLLHICFSRPDEAWVVGALLPQLGLAEGQYWTRAEDALGAPALTEIERAVTRCRYTLLVASLAASVDEWVTYAGVLAQHAGLEDGRERLIIVARDFAPGSPEACAIVPLRQRCLTYLDCSSPERMAAEVERLTQQLALAAASDQPLACPYPGLRAFGTGPGEFDRLDLFFGRETEERALIERLRGGAPRLLLVGTSGSGKSSLMRARVLPALRGDGVVVRAVRPGRTPTAALRAAVEALGDTRLGPALDAYLAAPVDDQAAAHARLTAAVPSLGVRRVLYVDPLEEVFLADDAARAGWFALIAALGAVPDLALLFSMRADFYADLMRSPMWDQLRDHRVELAPLRGDGLRRAIVRPAARVGVYVEVDLVERLVREADGDRAAEALPLLQATLDELWRKRTWRYLSLATYQQLADQGRPGLDVALGHHADATLAALDDARRALARRVLIDLVNLGDGRPNTRRRRTRDELRRAGDDDAQLGGVLEHLAANRLVSVGSEPLPGPADAVALADAAPSPLVDLAHEALITGWPAFVGWVAARKDAERTRRRFEGPAAAGARLQRRGGLLDDIELRECRAWLTSTAGRDLGASRALVDLVARSTTARSRARWLRRAAVTLLVAAVIAVSTLAVFNARNARRAETQTQIAQTREREARDQLARSYIGTAEELLRKGDTSRAAPYLVAAREVGEEGMSMRRLFRWATADLPQVHKHDSEVYAVAWSPDGTLLASAGIHIWVWDPDTDPSSARRLGDFDHADALAWSPDGSMLAACGVNGAKVFDPHTGDELADFMHGTHVRGVAWSPDSRMLATAGGDESARIWNVRSRALATQPLQHAGEVIAVAWSPDGSRVATGEGETVRVWDAATGAPASPALVHRLEVQSLAWSPDGARLATSDVSTLRVWDARSWIATETPYWKARLPGGVAWSPDGSKLAYTAYPAAQIWAIDDREPGQSLDTGEILQTLAWQPDGQLIATGSSAGTVRIWDPRTGKPVGPPLAHGTALTALAWSMSGRLATASPDGFARVWTIARMPSPLGKREPAPTLTSYSVTTSDHFATTLRWDVDLPPGSPLLASALAQSEILAWSPDGKLIALTAPNAPGVQMWDATTGQATSIVLEAARLPQAIAWGPNGERLVIIADSHAAVWNVVTETAVALAFPPEETRIFAFVSWSPDGTRIATSDDQGTVRIWNPDDGSAEMPPLTLAGWRLSWSPDGTRLAMAGPTAVQLWDRRLKIVARSLPCSDATAVAWSPDGTRLATARNDKTVQIWDAATGRPRAPSIEHTAAVLSVAWSPDGRALATGTQNHLAQIWDASTGLALAPVFRHAAEVVAVSWNSDGSRLATVTTERTVRVWDVSWDQRTLVEWQALLHARYPYRVDRNGLLVFEP